MALQEQQSAALQANSPSPLIEFRNVSFGYGERLILDDITLSVPRGKVTALMGASGGGKTTILRLIGGQNRSQQGQLLF
ncbi:MAG: ATP-binding cassette domain-containing protein, partial [Burkholderiaceae bacterium]